MLTTTLFALVAAATMGFAAEAGEAGGYAAPSYDDSSDPSYDGGSSGSNDPTWGSGGRWGGGGGSPKWGGGGWGKGYGSCHTCHTLPKGIHPHPSGAWYPNTFHPSNPFHKHFDKIANKCSSVNSVGGGDQAAGCCNKIATSDGDENENGGLLGGLLSGVLGAGSTCTLDIASSLCSSGSVACCDTTNSGNGFSLVNVQSVCAPITL